MMRSARPHPVGKAVEILRTTSALAGCGKVEPPGAAADTIEPDLDGAWVEAAAAASGSTASGCGDHVAVISEHQRLVVLDGSANPRGRCHRCGEWTLDTLVGGRAMR